MERRARRGQSGGARGGWRAAARIAFGLLLAVAGARGEPAPLEREAATGGEGARDRAAAFFAGRLKPFLEEYCFSCHGRRKRGGITFSS